MNLRAFITQTISDVIGGVTDAQRELPSGIVIPTVSLSFKSVETGISHVQAIDFEVEVRAEKAKGSEAKLSVFTAVIGGGVGGKSAEESGHTATLRFKIPVSFPRTPNRSQPAD